MVKKAYKILELDWKKAENKEADGVSNLKGVIVIIAPEKSEVAQHLDIKEKGIYSVKVL